MVSGKGGRQLNNDLATRRSGREAGTDPGRGVNRPGRGVATTEGRRADVVELELDGITKVLHQYAIALHRMSTEVLDTMFGQEFFPSGAVDDAALVPRILRASTQMDAMGLWRPPVGPFRTGLCAP